MQKTDAHASMDCLTLCLRTVVTLTTMCDILSKMFFYNSIDMCEIGTSMVGLNILQVICMLSAREQENQFL